jgi:hypothetical protein
MVLTHAFEVQDTFDDWPLAQFQDGRVVYRHSRPHFTATDYVELSIYDPAKRQSSQIYPPQPEPPLRRAYLERVRVAYERCCVLDSPADCGRPFRLRNHPCDPERFENSIRDLVVDDAHDSLTFRARFADIVGTEEVTYSFRHLRKARRRASATIVRVGLA